MSSPRPPSSRRLSLRLLAVGLLLGLAVPAGYAATPLTDQTGQVLSWALEQWPIPLAASDSAWDQAAADWTAMAAVGFEPVPAVGLDAADGVTAAVTIDDAERWLSVVGDPDLIAFTLVTADGARIVDADVVLNGARFEFSQAPRADRFHKRTVLAHELGHVLGLGHACGSPAPACASLEPDDPRLAAVMIARLSPGLERRPAADDVMGAAQFLPQLPNSRSPSPRWALGADGALIAGDRVDADDQVRLFRDGTASLRTVSQTVEPMPVDAVLWTAEGQGRRVGLPRVGPDAGRIDVDGSIGDGGLEGSSGAGSDGCSVGRNGGRAPVSMLAFFACLWGVRRRLNRAHQRGRGC